MEHGVVRGRKVGQDGWKVSQDSPTRYALFSGLGLLRRYQHADPALPPCPTPPRAGTVEPFSKEEGVTNQLEKRYFNYGNLGFNAFKPPHLKAVTGGDKSPVVGMLICNDRRWAEGWRVYGLQGVELMCIGYVSTLLPGESCVVYAVVDFPPRSVQNTTAWAPQLWGIDPDSMTREEAAADAMFHHKLVCQANAYTNASKPPCHSPKLPIPRTQLTHTGPSPQPSWSPPPGAASTTACTRSSQAQW